MVKPGMYVRCPADEESETDPRVFVCGQISKIDDFKNTALVKLYDPFNYSLFFEDLPKKEIEVSINDMDRCTAFLGTEIVVKKRSYVVITVQEQEDGFYHYYVQDKKNKSIISICESNAKIPFINGEVDPSVQLTKYEFQNPCWYFGHAVVSKSMNILENSIYGFKELAGAKIYLLPHQVNTIMRCLSEDPCRYMLADEVGMGKTIEAISILKIYLKQRSNKKVLIVVPDTLKKQWETELLLKYGIAVGIDSDNNEIFLKAFTEINAVIINQNWDFAIIDEVHKYLSDKDLYEYLHQLSLNTLNILLLSATPVQDRSEEYLYLLRLLQPQKYDLYDLKSFNELNSKQNKLIQKTALILDDVEDFEEEINNAVDSKNDPHKSEDCEDIFEEIYAGLKEICDELKDDKLSDLLGRIKFEEEDLGLDEIKIIISYICGNYQVESKIIRNRRKIFETDENGNKRFPKRELMEISYPLDKDLNTHEALCYQILSDWLSNDAKNLDIDKIVKPILESFFSSPWAFSQQLNKLMAMGVCLNEDLIRESEKWVLTENNILDNLCEILDDPEDYESEFCSRLVLIMNLIYEELYDKKLVIFTDFSESFKAYRKALEKVFPPEEISFYGAGMAESDLELNTYRFQNEPGCRIMLCDCTGGEGRNLQCADYVIHLDLPWDANLIEQRIGRLDRLERDPERSVVTSIVIYTEDTFEHALFDFWNKGLKIFTQSLSGMEIIMDDIHSEIVNAVKEDFKYGIFEKVPRIIELSNTMRETVRKEQNYDVASLMYRPLFDELKRVIDYYSRNENTLFADSMAKWADLAGFVGHENEPGIISYSPNSFSPRAAINSQLIPPHWNEYINSNQNKFVNSVQELYNNSKGIKNEDRAIKGTFIRKLAIENDYLHFFAPGDEIYDCIVDNALHSCKGKSAAFAVRANINWKGLIFVFSVSPDEELLIQNGISVNALGPYRNYLISSQVIIPISLENLEEVTSAQIIQEYNRIIKDGYYKRKIVHLGKRTLSAAYLKDEITGESNVSWFRKNYSEEEWSLIVSNSRQQAFEMAVKQIGHRSNIKGAKEEMEREISSRVSNSVYYEFNDDEIDEIKKEQEILLESLNNPKVKLNSAAFIWMVK